jgi:hypothetical protein
VALGQAQVMGVLAAARVAMEVVVWALVPAAVEVTALAAQWA